MALTSLRAYSRHRGCTIKAVQDAISSNRLRHCLGRDEKGVTKIADVQLADREWLENTNHGTSPREYQRSKKIANRNSSKNEKRQSKPGAEIDPFSELLDEDQDQIKLDEILSKFEDGADPDKITLAEAALVDKIYKAKMAKLEYEKEAGKLVELDKVKEGILHIISVSKTKVLGIPSKAKSNLPHLSLADIAELEKIARETLIELSEYCFRS